MASRTIDHFDALTADEIASLKALSAGESEAKIPREHLYRFLDLGYVEQKMSGHVLTAVGRYQLESRAREDGLSLLANRWRRRAEKLNAMAREMTSNDGSELRRLAESWRAMAEQIERIEKAERQSGSLI